MRVQALSTLPWAVEEWDACCGDRDFYLSSTWLTAAEATSERPPSYFAAQDESGRIVGATVGYFLGVDSPFSFCRPDNVMSERTHRDARDGVLLGLMPSLSLGGRNPSHSRIAVSSGADRPQVMNLLVEAAEQEAVDRGAATACLLFVEQEDEDLAKVLRVRGWRSEESEPAAVLDLMACATYDDYLASLSSKRRETVRRDERRLRQAGVSFEVRSLREADVAAIVALEQGLYERHSTPYDAEMSTRLYRSLASAAAGEVYLSTATLQGDLVGFSLFFMRGEVVHARAVGIAYRTVGNLPVYFGSLYYSLIRFALSRGSTQIRYSTGSEAVKVSRGCRLVAQRAYAWSIDPSRRALSRTLV